MMKFILSLLFFLCITCSLQAQKLLYDKGFSKTLTYKEYLKLAINDNLLLEAEKYKVEAADARIALAKIFPNPTFTIGNASGDITGQHLQQQLFHLLL